MKVNSILIAEPPVRICGLCAFTEELRGDGKWFHNDMVLLSQGVACRLVVITIDCTNDYNLNTANGNF